jgi:Ca2+-binding EF-hand superfamily protein
MAKAAADAATMRSLIEQFQQTKSDTHLEALFNLFDKDHNQSLSKVEVMTTLGQMGYGGQSEDAANAMLELGDTDRNGYLNQREFLVFGRAAFAN